jgi:hypothetical protein
LSSATSLTPAFIVSKWSDAIRKNCSRAAQDNFFRGLVASKLGSADYLDDEFFELLASNQLFHDLCREYTEGVGQARLIKKLSANLPSPTGLTSDEEALRELRQALWLLVTADARFDIVVREAREDVNPPTSPAGSPLGSISKILDGLAKALGRSAETVSSKAALAGIVAVSAAAGGLATRVITVAVPSNPAQYQPAGPVDRRPATDNGDLRTQVAQLQQQIVDFRSYSQDQITRLDDQITQLDNRVSADIRDMNTRITNVPPVPPARPSDELCLLRGQLNRIAIMLGAPTEQVSCNPGSPGSGPKDRAETSLANTPGPKSPSIYGALSRIAGSVASDTDPSRPVDQSLSAIARAMPADSGGWQSYLGGTFEPKLFPAKVETISPGSSVTLHAKAPSAQKLGACVVMLTTNRIEEARAVMALDVYRCDGSLLIPHDDAFTITSTSQPILLTGLQVRLASRQKRGFGIFTRYPSATLSVIGPAGWEVSP